MERIYCSSWESVSVFELEKADLAGVFRQGFCAEEQWKENYRSSSESARILNLRNNGEMLLASYHKIGKGFELKKQWSDVSKTFLSICTEISKDPRTNFCNRDDDPKEICSNEETYLAAAGRLADYGERD
ncbi:unnamed protein product [Sphagnum troendelagicum]|uniref:Uncharacterized protein n=1 Tax=Sphagnum troendelagicum TaxID=128251 RepID=A0ABP0UUY2_9BRYO